MREILFRGKRKDNGEWIYGNLLRTDDGVYIIQNHVPFHMLPKYEVDPSTVGQYTGLTDKNGKRIFEGDIVHCVARLDEANMVVIFEEGEFRIVLCEKFKTYIPGGGYYAVGCYEKEVIGNIHDNPELLERGRE